MTAICLLLLVAAILYGAERIAAAIERSSQNRGVK